MFKKLLLLTSAITGLAIGQSYSQEHARRIESPADSVKNYAIDEVVMTEEIAKLDPKVFRQTVNNVLNAGKPIASYDSPSLYMPAGSVAAGIGQYRGMTYNRMSATLDDDFPIYGDPYREMGMETKFHSGLLEGLNYDEVRTAGEPGPMGVLHAKFKDFRDKGLEMHISGELMRQEALVNYSIPQGALALYMDNDYLLVPAKELRSKLPTGNSFQALMQLGNKDSANMAQVSFMKFINEQNMTTFFNGEDVVLSQTAQHDIWTAKDVYHFDASHSITGSFVFEDWGQNNNHHTGTFDNDVLDFKTMHTGFGVKYSDDENTLGIKTDVLKNSTTLDASLSPEMIDRVFYDQLSRLNLSPILEQMAITEYSKISDYDKVFNRAGLLAKLEQRYKEQTHIDLMQNPDYVKFRNDILNPPILNSWSLGEAPALTTLYMKKKITLLNQVDNIVKFVPTFGVSIFRGVYATPVGGDLSYMNTGSEISLSYMYVPTSLNRNDLDRVFSSAATNMKAQSIMARYTLYPSDIKLSLAAYYKQFRDDDFTKSRGLEFMIENNRAGDQNFIYCLNATLLESVTADHPTVSSTPAFINFMVAYNKDEWAFSTGLRWQKGSWTNGPDNSYDRLHNAFAVDLGASYSFKIMKTNVVHIVLGGNNILGWLFPNELARQGPVVLYTPPTGTFRITLDHVPILD